MEETMQTPAPKNNSMMIGGIIVVIVIIGGFMFIQSRKTEENTNSIVEESPTGMTKEKGIDESVETGEDAQTTDENEVRVIDVEAGSFYYKPNVIKVKKGETVRIVMKSVSMMHNFNIDELGVKMPIVKNGDTGTVEFVADTVGTFEYYCSVGQHRAQGQVGTISVE